MCYTILLRLHSQDQEIMEDLVFEELPIIAIELHLSSPWESAQLRWFLIATELRWAPIITELPIQLSVPKEPLPSHWLTPVALKLVQPREPLMSPLLSKPSTLLVPVSKVPRLKPPDGQAPDWLVMFAVPVGTYSAW